MKYYKLRISAEALSRTRRKKLPWSAFILPPTSPGSVGDDAMVAALVGALRTKGFKRIGIVDWEPSCAWHYSAHVDERIDLSRYFRTGQVAGEILRFLVATRTYTHFFAMGADVLDGYYSEHRSLRRLQLVEWAAKAGARVTVTGFSFNDKPKPSAVDALRRLPGDVRLCVRDPISAERLRAATSRSPVEVADIAFLLKPAPANDKDLIEWLQGAGKSSGPLIGVNAVFTSNYFENRDVQAEDRYLKFHVDLIAAVSCAYPNAHFVLIPHDYREAGEKPLLEQLLAMLGADLQQRTHLLTAEYGAAQIKWLCGKLDFVVSSRMHLAIAAIGQETPVFCFGYQGKFEGLFKLLGQPELLGAIEDVVANPEATTQRILALIADASAVRKRLRGKLPEILELAEKNFAADG